MSIQSIFAYLVHPSKGSPKPDSIVGTTVPLAGSLFDLLQRIYDRSDIECDVDIAFRHTDGKQFNECRNLIIDHVRQQTKQTGDVIAERLAGQTDGRSGLGLLFLICGTAGGSHKILLSRFPTGSAIQVDDNQNNLSVKFLEKVFMRNKASYKAVAYRDRALTGAAFWRGRAIDKQLNSIHAEPSNYWIFEFLMSDFATTAAAGTRRLAIALREATKKAPVDVKQEIVAASKIAAGMAGQRLSINDFIARLNLSDAAQGLILAEVRSPSASLEVFDFDSAVYGQLISFKSIELDNGVLISAPAQKFEEVVHAERDGKEDQVKFTTIGRITDEKLRAGR